MTNPIRVFAFLCFGLSASALAQGGSGAHPTGSGAGHHGSHAPQAAQSTESPFAKETMAGMMAMHDAMMDPSKRNGNPDHDFLAMMIPHHQGALQMAETYLKYGKDEKVKKLAREIISSQKKEIAQMERWIASGVGARK